MIRTAIIYAMFDKAINYVFDSIDTKLKQHITSESEPALIKQLIELIKIEVEPYGAITDRFKQEYYVIRGKLMTQYWSGIDAPMPNDSHLRHHAKGIVRKADLLIDKMNMLELRKNPEFNRVQEVVSGVK